MRHPRAKDCGSINEHGRHKLRPYATTRWQSGLCEHRRRTNLSLELVPELDVMSIDVPGDAKDPIEDVDILCMLASDEVSKFSGGA